MFVLWTLHLIIKNAAIVDAGWALGLAMAAGFYNEILTGHEPRQFMVTLMAAGWGMRLGLHIFLTRVWGHEEEGRYRKLRESWGKAFPWKIFLFFQFQAILIVVFSIPFLLMCLNPSPKISILEWAALGLWAVGMIGEFLADWQLHVFKSNPAGHGRVCREGLWNYCRHPNYFFEWLIWCAFALSALAAPQGYLALICPILMLFFIFKLTGIPATEAQAIRTKGDDYREYQRTTSGFVPWFPKK